MSQSTLVDVVARWSTTEYVARLAFLVVTGVAWTTTSLQFVLFHPNYWDPTAFADWFAVWAYTASWVLGAGAIMVFGEVARPDTLMRRTVFLVAIAAATTGIANALEDGFELAGFGTAYVIGFFTAVLGLVLVAAMTWAGRTRRLWFVPAVAAVAMFTVTLGGGPLALVAWLGLAMILVRARPRPLTAQ